MQNWDIAQDDRGVLYFANNDGMLCYNGYDWNLLRLPNKTIVRSLEVAGNGHIYCGGQNAFGRFEPDKVGQWVFHSLRESIPVKYREFEDVWNMSIKDGEVYFRSAGRIYRYSETSQSVYDTMDFRYFTIVEGKILAQAETGYLYELNGNRFGSVNGAEMLVGTLIIGIVHHPEHGLLIATEKDGMFSYKDGMVNRPGETWNDYFKLNQITCMTTMDNGDIAIGTNFSGVVILDAGLKIKYHIHKDNGLLNNKVMCMIASRDQNLWLGLNKGINFIETNSPFTYIKPDGQLDGIGYAAAIHNNKIYFGTNNGLYYADMEKDNLQIEDLGKYTYIPGTRGQVWGLDLVDDQLILSHGAGVFSIQGGNAIPFYTDRGVWLMQEFQGDEYLTGTYNGIYLCTRIGNQFQMGGRLSEMNESSRFIEQDEMGNIWMAHPYRGIFRLSRTVGEEWLFELYGQERGLPSGLHNHVFKVMDKVVFCAEKGIYEFNAVDKRFDPYAPLNDMFGAETTIRRLYEDKLGNIWYITEDDVGILMIKDIGLERKLETRTFPKLKEMMNAGWESIYPYDDRNVFIASTEGFIHYDPSKDLMEDTSLLLILNEVRTTGRRDSLFFKGLFYDGSKILAKQPEGEMIRFPPLYNTLQFNFSAVNFSERSDLMYRFRLIGFDNEWSEWSDQRIKEFTRLKPGKYNFQVQSKAGHSELHGELNYRFEIRRPWYGSTVARVFYGLLILLLLFIALKSNKRRFKKLEEEVEQTVSQSRIEIEKLEQANTEEQLKHKKRELITSTMHLVQKNEIMKEIQESLLDIRKNCKDEATAARIRKLLHLVELDTDLNEHWEDLMYHFNEVHKEFFTNLKGRYDTLTNKDLKLCAYLRMNLSTKEIALLANVSHRGIDASRYRLRKKLNLPSDVDLNEFLMNF